MTRTWTRIVLVVLFLVAVVIAASSVAGLASAGSDNSMTAVAKQATARFHNLDAAKAAGWNVEVVDVNGLAASTTSRSGDGRPLREPKAARRCEARPGSAGGSGLRTEPRWADRARCSRVHRVRGCVDRGRTRRSSVAVRRAVLLTPSPTGSVFRRSGHFTSGSGSRTRPGSSSRGTRACTAEGTHGGAGASGPTMPFRPGGKPRLEGCPPAQHDGGIQMHVVDVEHGRTSGARTELSLPIDSLADAAMTGHGRLASCVVRLGSEVDRDSSVLGRARCRAGVLLEATHF